MTPLRRLADVARRPTLRVVGLMAGTSADGVDAALAHVTDGRDGLAVDVRAALTVPYEPALRARVLEAHRGSAAEAARLDAELGEVFADAVLAVLAHAGAARDDVDLVGSHGQTLLHAPGQGPVRAAGRRGAVTLQVARPATIAERTGLPVVADFRARDCAAGGEGAPLVPYVDWLVLRDPRHARLALNLGGIANVTLVTPDVSDVRAFDAGPANGPLDAAAALLLDGAACDRDGAAAARGRVAADEVARLLADPWFRTPPPRSLSRETWAEPFVRAFVARRPDLGADDVLATLSEFVAAAVAGAVREHLPAGAAARLADVVVSGGGVRNAHVMRRLAAHFAPVPVRSSAELGHAPDAREAVAFAVLAAEWLRGRATNLPAVTGADGPRLLGTLTLP